MEIWLGELGKTLLSSRKGLGTAHFLLRMLVLALPDLPHSFLSAGLFILLVINTLNLPLSSETRHGPETPRSFEQTIRKDSPTLDLSAHVKKSRSGSPPLSWLAIYFAHFSIFFTDTPRPGNTSLPRANLQNNWHNTRSLCSGEEIEV